jgi:hypothetical protein
MFLRRRLIAKALKPRRPSRQLASKSYGVRLRPVVSGKHRFGIHSFADRAWRAPYGDARGGKSWEHGRKDGKRVGARAEIRRACGEECRRNHRAERGALAGKMYLPARPHKRVLPRRREKLLPASLRLLLPCSPSAQGAAGGGLLFPRHLLLSSIDQDTEPPPCLHSSSSRTRAALFPSSPSARISRRRAAVSPPPPLVLHRAGHKPPPRLQSSSSRTEPSSSGLRSLGNNALYFSTCLCPLASSVLCRAGQQHGKQNNKQQQLLSAWCSSIFFYKCSMLGAQCWPLLDSSWPICLYLLLL